jgi:hypothetical protein
MYIRVLKKTKMKKRNFLIFSAITILSFSCAETNTEATNSESDTTAVIIETEEEAEASLKFDGVDKGTHTLYGHTDINVEGNEITTAEMFEKLANDGNFEGKVIVNIAEVCQKAGCWITFENGESEPIRVFFRDHFTIPTNTLAGTEAILFGSTVQDTLSVDFQKHLLDDAKEAGEKVDQAEYDKITEDLIETTFDCESILVKK